MPPAAVSDKLPAIFAQNNKKGKKKKGNRRKRDATPAG